MGTEQIRETKANIYSPNRKWREKWFLEALERWPEVKVQLTVGQQIIFPRPSDIRHWIARSRAL